MRHAFDFNVSLFMSSTNYQNGWFKLDESTGPPAGLELVPNT